VCYQPTTLSRNHCDSRTLLTSFSPKDSFEEDEKKRQEEEQAKADEEAAAAAAVGDGAAAGAEPDPVDDW